MVKMEVGRADWKKTRQKMAYKHPIVASQRSKTTENMTTGKMKGPNQKSGCS